MGTRPGAATGHHAAGDRSEVDPSTRAFLFADLRGYTSFVERRGAAAAAELLGRYRSLMRREIERFDGAEIRTEGDSFYVVFGSVTAAVRCGLAIVQAAGEAADPSADAIRVGIGVHAGETVQTDEGYVGQPVNIAARLCALAGAGEVLVSDTVRALTQTVLPVHFEFRGRRRLKGIGEPLSVFAAQAAPSAATWGGGRSTGRWRRIAAGGVLAGLALAAVGWFALRPSGLPPGQWIIGVSLPTSGLLADEGGALLRAIQLGVADAARKGGPQVAIEVRDSGAGAGDFGEDPEASEEIARAFVGDPRVIGMIGSLQSFAAEPQLPITNRAGLLQCSPSTTDSRLTKPRDGALDLRSAYPDRINYVRLPAAADVEAEGSAWFAYNELGVRSVLVIDDAQPTGRRVADAFEREFTAIGGTVERRAVNPGTDPGDALAPLAALGGPTLVFFGGFTVTGAPELRRAMVDAGFDDVPLLGWDGIRDGSGEEGESYIARTGDAAVGTYASRPSLGTIRTDFDRRYQAEYGELPGAELYEYTAAAYACAQIIIEALARLAPTGPSADELREAVRATVTDPEARFETVLGTVGFDENGDSTQQVVTFYRFDPAAANGKGDWVVIQQRDFGRGG